MQIDRDNRNGFRLTGYYLPPATGGSPTKLVVILHGLSADGAGMIAFGPQWANVLPGAAFLAPNAPFPFDMGNAGYQWVSMQSRSSETLVPELRKAARILDDYLDDALARLGLDDGRLAIVGFSQGGMMALHVGPRRGRTPAAVVCMSGELLEPQLLPGEITARPPVLLTHGAADEVVPPARMASARATLEHEGLEVESLLQPNKGHPFDAATASVVKLFLSRRLKGGRDHVV